MNINRKTIGGLAVAGILAVAAPAFAASQGGPSLDGHADVHAQVGNVDTPSAPTTVPTPPTTEAPSVSAPQPPDAPSVSAPDTSGARSRVHTQVQRAKNSAPSASAPSVPAAPSTPSTPAPTPPPSGGGQSSGGSTVQATANAALSVSANG